MKLIIMECKWNPCLRTERRFLEFFSGKQIHAGVSVNKATGRSDRARICGRI